MAATRVPSLSFFAKGRAVAKPCQPLTANHTTNTPIMPAQPKITQKSKSAPQKQNSLPVHQQQPDPPVPSGVPSDSPRSPLDPLAPEFVPFSVFLPLYDSDDELADDAESPQHADRVDHLFEDTLLWSKFDESDLGGEPPAPCDCHQVSRGSCPDFKAYHVDRIARGLEHSGLTPNMDGLREPLKYPSFPVDKWEQSLRGYFDAHEIVQALRYGWDVSFVSEPKPKNAQWNLQGASLFESHVQKYVDT